MWGRTCIPRTVYQVLYPCKKHCRCAQAQPFLVFCWLLVALIRAPAPIQQSCAHVSGLGLCWRYPRTSSVRNKGFLHALAPLFCAERYTQLHISPPGAEH
jgi:hypothetical protein